MKPKRFIHSAGAWFLAAILGVSIVGCPGNPSATNPMGNQVVPNSNGPLIEGFFVNYNNTSSVAFVCIQGSAGNPVTNAAVSLTTPNGSFPVTYSSIGSLQVPPNSGITSVTGGVYGNLGLAYTPNQNCTFNIIISGTAYSSSFTPINAPGAISTGTSGVTCTWSNGGNEDWFTAAGNDLFNVGPPITSPAIIPASSFPSDPAGSGHDLLYLYLLQTTQPAFSGCKSSSVIATGTEININSY
jgi:hypothetical protein